MGGQELQLDAWVMTPLPRLRHVAVPAGVVVWPIGRYFGEEPAEVSACLIGRRERDTASLVVSVVVSAAVAVAAVVTMFVGLQKEQRFAAWPAWLARFGWADTASPISDRPLDELEQRQMPLEIWQKLRAEEGWIAVVAARKVGCLAKLAAQRLVVLGGSAWSRWRVWVKMGDLRDLFRQADDSVVR